MHDFVNPRAAPFRRFGQKQCSMKLKMLNFGQTSKSVVLKPVYMIIPVNTSCWSYPKHAIGQKEEGPVNWLTIHWKTNRRCKNWSDENIQSFWRSNNSKKDKINSKEIFWCIKLTIQKISILSKLFHNLRNISSVKS